jgi:hypothetical protein
VERGATGEMDAGFDHHLVKPVDPSTLLELLSSLQYAASAFGNRFAN